MQTNKQKLIARVARRIHVLGLSEADTLRLAKVLVTGKHDHWDNEDYSIVLSNQCKETEVSCRVAGGDVVLYGPEGYLVQDIFTGKLELTKVYSFDKVMVRLWDTAA